ncbi:MAG: hypothetical protein HFH13_07290 [Dorea sp.]|nr:hypothetical protein [Dorea sp.]
MNYSDLVPVTGTIVNISGNDCCNQMIALRTEDGVVNFFITSDTQVINSRMLRRGMRIAAFYDSTLPVPLIFPPQYQAVMITVLGRNEQIALNYFDGNLIAADNSLQLNVGRNTVVRTINGQMFTCSLGDRMLLVYYSATTRSIPPQTTPEKIIVLC